MFRTLTVTMFCPMLLAMYVPSCHPTVVQPAPPDVAGARMAELWERPANLAEKDLLHGRWGRSGAPAPQATYQFVAPKLTGTNPGMTVRDEQGRKWHVKQAHPIRGAEGPVEVTLARVLEAVGYHQPPTYYLASFTLAGDGPTRTVEGGRFRLSVRELDDVGEWSWQENPFVGSRPYNGLLALLLVFNSSDLKNANNVLYHYRPSPDRVDTWYVVRDLGAALGETARIEPRRGQVALFERSPFILGIDGGFVRFDYHGFHQELIAGRIRTTDVRWACDLLSGLTGPQWHDAFRAGGWDEAIARRYIAALQRRISQGRMLEPAPVD